MRKFVTAAAGICTLAIATNAHSQCYTGEGCGRPSQSWLVTQYYELCSGPTAPYCSKSLDPAYPNRYIRMVYDRPVISEDACHRVMAEHVFVYGIEYGSCIPPGE